MNRVFSALLFAGCVLLPPLLLAGGPRWVAGSSYFDPAAKGKPIVWADGVLHYYTDQGDLSPLLPRAAADNFVQDAISRWTSVPTAAVAAIRDGDLDEDVSGANVSKDRDDNVNMPLDILDTAISKPVAFVYDADGQVTDALVGPGASLSCFDNSVTENTVFGPDGHIVHALVILNGKCATTSDQLADMKYRLVRALGRVLGVGWTQTQINPSLADSAGFSVMHEKDPFNCIPISLCYMLADQLKTDDQATLSRLYPVTTDNLANFSGKTVFADTAFRIHGSVRFVDANGNGARPMQGVNVVARWLDPTTRTISSTFVTSSVSGFLFRGNAGNPATGFTDAAGDRLDRFGSDDVALEGAYDLSGAEGSIRSASQEFQISVEPLDPTWSLGVGPYAGFVVTQSGTSTLPTVKPTRGKDFTLDIVMFSSAPQVEDWFGAQSFAAPAALPPSGDWTGALTSYGMTHYFRLSGQANRTLAVEVTALDEKGNVSETKARPVVGIWTMRDNLMPAEASTPIAFNTGVFGFTRLDQVSLLESTDFRLGIADYRGDGRPDFRYHARVFYGDRVVPARSSVAGGTALTILGLGFRPNTTIQLGGSSANVLGMTAGSMVTRTSAQADGVKDIVLQDPQTGSSSIMSGALTFGAGPNDLILPVSVTNPPVAVGAEAPNPIKVRVVAPDHVTPVVGASVVFQSSPPASLSACGGAEACTILTDQGGLASTRAALRTRAAVTISAVLAPASYSPPKQVPATLAPKAAASLDISLGSEMMWIAQGSSIDVPLSALVLGSAVPQAGRTINFMITKGTAGLSAVSAVTDSAGRAAVNLHAAGPGEIAAVACAAPENNICSRLLHVIQVPAANLRLQPVSGNLQMVFGKEPLQPLVVRVTDASDIPNPVTAAGVTFQAVITQPQSDLPPVAIGDTNVTQYPSPVVLGSYQLAGVSDIDGLVRLQPPQPESPDVVVDGTAFAGSASLSLHLRVMPRMAVQVTPARALSSVIDNSAKATATVGKKSPSAANPARLQNPHGAGPGQVWVAYPSPQPGGPAFLPDRESAPPVGSASDSCQPECSECSSVPRCPDPKRPESAPQKD